MKTLLCLVLLGCHVPKREAALLLVAGGFDSGTTYHVLTTCPTCREINPTLRPFARSAAVFPAIAAGDTMVLGLTSRFGKRHPTLRQVVVYSFIALHIYCGFRNIGVARKYSGIPAVINGPAYSAWQFRALEGFTLPQTNSPITTFRMQKGPQ
jgi:hypothetical protein